MNINPKFSIPLLSAWKHMASIPKSFKQQTPKLPLALWARNYFFTALGLKIRIYFVLVHDELPRYICTITDGSISVRIWENFSPPCQAEQRS